MVDLALYRHSALAAIQAAKAGGHSVWVGSEVISEAKHHLFGSDGVSVTRFSYPLTGVELPAI